MEHELVTLQAKIYRQEAQRNASRVLQETQQNKLRQAIDLKQNQLDGYIYILFTVFIQLMNGDFLIEYQVQ